MGRPAQGPPRVCETCGRSFHVPPSLVARGGGRFCSRACRHLPDNERFWRLVRKADDPNGCWTLAGQDGYGRFWSNEERRLVPATHVAWASENGPVPPGMHVLHRCDNPPCVRPSHLFLGTRSDNMQDMHAKSRYPTSRRVRVRRGVDLPQAKLTEADIPAIRAAVAGGEPAARVARRHGVSRFAVRAVVSGETWRHIG